MTNPSSTPGQSRPILLLAEDDQDQSDMLREILEDEGYAVETAFRGDTALQKVEKNCFDLVILDIRLPGLNGRQVLAEIRRQWNKKRLPVIVVSAFASATELDRFTNDGANASFSKPYEVNSLLHQVAGLIASKKNEGAP